MPSKLWGKKLDGVQIRKFNSYESKLPSPESILSGSISSNLMKLKQQECLSTQTLSNKDKNTPR